MHTTGPWTAMVTDNLALDGTPALWDIVQRSSGGTVAEIQSHNPDDAALVAAAPDLLAALQWALAQIEDSLDPDHRAALESAHAVVARATGGQ